jgi:hypothetical protein
MATQVSKESGEPVQVLWCRIGHDVAVLRSAYHAPRPERQAADDNETDVRLDEARK